MSGDFEKCLGWKELWEDLDGRESYPVHKLQQYLQSLPESIQGGTNLTIDLSGIEHVTDHVLKVLTSSLQNSIAEGVVRIDLTGCHHVTDFGVFLLSSSFKKLKEVCLDGCKNITEQSIFHLKANCSDLHTLSLVGTDVGAVPLPVGDTTIHLDGCPIYTGIVPGDKTSLDLAVPFEECKLVILSPTSLTFSVLQLLEEESPEKTPDGFTSEVCCMKYTPHVTMGSAVSNVFEIHTDSPVDYSPFLSSGALYIVAVDYSSIDQSTKSICEAYHNIRACTSTASVMVLIFQNANDDAKVIDVAKNVSSHLEGVHNLLKKHIDESHGAHDFFQQNLLSRNLKSLQDRDSKSHSLNLYSCDRANCSKLKRITPTAEDSESKSVCTLQQAFQHHYTELKKSSPWEMCPVKSEVAQFCNQLPEGRILPMDIFLSNTTLYKGEVAPHRKLLSRLHNMGRVLYFPNIHHEAVILDVQWLMDIVSHPHQLEGCVNGDNSLELPADMPMFRESDLAKLLEDVCPESEFTLVYNILKIYRLVSAYHCWPLGTEDKQKVAVFTTDLPLVPTVRYAEDGLDIWEEYWPVKKLPTDAEVTYVYEVHSGIPSIAMIWIGSKMMQMRDVLFFWRDGIIYRDGAVEMLVKKTDHNVPKITVQARCTRFEAGHGKIDAILMKYIWSVMNDACTLIEAVLCNFPNISFMVEALCPGECLNDTHYHSVSTLDLTPDSNHPILCKKCGQNINEKHAIYLRGRKRCLPFHDWREERSGFRCSSCRTSDSWAMKHWALECKIHPNFAGECFDLYGGRETLGCDMNQNCLKYTSSVHEPYYLISKQAMAEVDFTEFAMQILDPGGLEVLLVKEPQKYLKVDEEKKHNLCQFSLNLDMGEGTQKDDPQQFSKPSLKMKTGDFLKIKVRRRDDDKNDIDANAFQCEVLKNGMPVHQVSIPDKCFVLIRVTGHEENTQKLGDTRAVIYSPTCPVVTSGHFEVGTALVHRVDGDATWWGGVVSKIQDGYIFVERTTSEEGTEKEPRKYLPRSENLAPICHFNSDASMVLDTEPVKSSEKIFAYLKQYYLTPAPMGLFRRFMNLPFVDSTPLQLHSTKARSCVASIYSPFMLQHSYRIAQKPAVLKRQPLGFVILPGKVKRRDLLHTGRHQVHDWTRQEIGFMCKGEMLAQSTIRIGHLQDARGPLLTQEDLMFFSENDKSKFWKFLINSVYYLLQSYAQLTAQQPILPSWTKIFPNIPADVSPTYVSYGISKLTAWYQHTLFLFCALSSSLNHFYPPYFNGKEFGDIVSKITKIMKEEVKPNNDIGFCDTHHYLLRAFKMQQDSDNPDSLPKLELDLSKLGENTQCIREVKVEEVSCDSIPPVVLECMQKFPNLVRVQLSKCGLVSIEGIEICENLKTLEVNANAITELHVGFVGLKDVLQVLNISDNPLKELPVYITDFTHLVNLTVSNTKITEIPEDIGKLTTLQVLDIHHNRISKLPDSFRKLKNLDTLNICGIPWLFYAFKKGVLVSRRHFLNWCRTTLNGKHSMSTFSDQELIEMFNACQKDSSSDVLTHRGVHQLNDTLFRRLPRLGQSEGADQDPFGGFPPQIFSCTRLTQLYVSFQGIRFVPDQLKKLRLLKKLMIDHNKLLRTVSAEVGKLPLNQINLFACPILQTPPPEVLHQGMAYTLMYMKKLAAGSVACYKTKLMFVGLGGAGKTSLMRSLMSGDLKTPPIGTEGITDGIDIKTWVVNRNNQPLTYSVWDFAGQTVYYNTHQFFLSSRAIYFLTWNSRLGFEHAGLEFWLSSIQCHAPKAPVFVVGTHADQVSKSDLPREDLKRNYPSIVGFFSVSSVTGLGIDNLLNQLLKVTLKQPYIGERIPEIWIKLERAIARDREEKRNILSWSDVEDRATRIGLDEAEIKQAVKFLHDLGSLQHFDNESLKDKIVINPQWIVDVMACVVSVHNSCIKEGRLKYEDISRIWADYPADLHDWLLKLTEAFDLTFPLPDQKVNIVPCLLPQAKPQFAWPDLTDSDGSRQNKIVYKFDILPAGLFNRAQVRLYQISDSSAMWKRGSLLQKNDHVGMMLMQSTSEVLVMAQGPRPENIIFLVHEVFESLINDFFRGVNYEYLIPCNDCMKVTSEDPTMFSSTVLRRAIALKAPFLQCHSSFHSLRISDIQAVMPPELSDDFDLQFHMTMKELTRIHEGFKYDCGLIYSMNDVPGEDSEAVHPKQVAEDLESEKYGFKCWYADELEKQPLNLILKSLGNCKVIIIFISENFVNDNFCEKLFRFVYDILRKVTLLVTLGKGHLWRNSDVGVKVVHKVYINMQRPWQYKSKLDGLVKQLKCIVRSDKVEHSCDVFISYSWLNSIHAIQSGHVARKDEAIGFGDPRKVKEFLENNGISCWIDIEKTGVDGLFEDIANGLKQCRIMVACISNEYSLSNTCQMEFRFAAVTLRMPIVLAVVGNGYAWESTEIGLLSLGHDKSNFQVNNNQCYEQLLSDVRDKLTQVEKPSEVKHTPSQPEGFTELFELAQRKFMRQFSGYVENSDEYPRLFVVDTLPSVKSDDEASLKESDLEFDLTDENQGGAESVKDSTDYCFRILCEFEGGWHTCHSGFPINMIGNELSHLWKISAPYFGRIMKLLKHSNINLNCFGTMEGDSLIDVLEKHVGVNIDLKPIYLEIRQHIIKKDTDLTYGGLRWCYLPNGKYLWLCDEHQELPRVTILETQSIAASSDTDIGDDDLVVKLRKLDERGRFARSDSKKNKDWKKKRGRNKFGKGNKERSEGRDNAFKKEGKQENVKTKDSTSTRESEKLEITPETVQKVQKLESDNLEIPSVSLLPVQKVQKPENGNLETPSVSLLPAVSKTVQKVQKPENDKLEMPSVSLPPTVRKSDAVDNDIQKKKIGESGRRLSLTVPRESGDRRRTGRPKSAPPPQSSQACCIL